MGGRQSSSPASDGRTRAYSGSDIPSSTGRGPIRGPAGVAASTSSPLARYPYTHAGHSAAAGGGAGGSEHTPPTLGSRSRSVGGIRSQAQLGIPGAARDSGSSTPEEGGRERAPGAGGGGSRLLIGSLPSHLSPHLFGAAEDNRNLLHGYLAEGKMHIDASRKNKRTNGCGKPLTHGSHEWGFQYWTVPWLQLLVFCVGEYEHWCPLAGNPASLIGRGRQASTNQQRAQRR
ncbi:unnamed protein product [Ranitomeya imitator]|uniref:Uncharacterized protein n=1 Tax=Ranitomeya imitator TaxID=111125 RepID=A0ABN9LU60_9NEOB|nr:unnamed protein product [Ranitomeya imitator]